MTWIYWPRNYYRRGCRVDSGIYSKEGFRLRSKDLEDRTAESSARAADLQDGWESSKEDVGIMRRLDCSGALWVYVLCFEGL